VADLLAFPSEDGSGLVYVETADVDRPVTRGGAVGSNVIEASESLEQVVGRIGPIVRSMVAEIRRSAEWPDEVEVEFAVKISADSNLVIAKAGGEANFRIALRWGDRGGR
jgi:hypothetical protein